MSWTLYKYYILCKFFYANNIFRHKPKRHMPLHAAGFFYIFRKITLQRRYIEHYWIIIRITVEREYEFVYNVGFLSDDCTRDCSLHFSNARIFAIRLACIYLLARFPILHGPVHITFARERRRRSYDVQLKSSHPLAHPPFLPSLFRCRPWGAGKAIYMSKQLGAIMLPSCTPQPSLFINPSIDTSTISMNQNYQWREDQRGN